MNRLAIIKTSRLSVWFFDGFGFYYLIWTHFLFCSIYVREVCRGRNLSRQLCLCTWSFILLQALSAITLIVYQRFSELGDLFCLCLSLKPKSKRVATHCKPIYYAWYSTKTRNRESSQGVRLGVWRAPQMHSRMPLMPCRVASVDFVAFAQYGWFRTYSDFLWWNCF